MNFANIKMLFLIWAVPALFFIYLFGIKKRKKILSGFASRRGLKAILPESGALRRRVKAGLTLTALLFMVIALSGPRYGYKWQEVKQKGIDIIIAIDCSKSMLAEDIKPSRLYRAKMEVYDLLKMLRGDRVGLVAFAGTAFLQCPLTIDYQAFNLFLSSLSPDFLPVGGTDIPGAVNAALAGFDKKETSEKAIILITDGESTATGSVEAAETAKKAGVKLFCIGIGKDAGVPVPDKNGGFKKDRSGRIILAKLDEATLKKMAILTGGAYVKSIAGDMDLEDIYNVRIRGQMKKTTLTETRKKVWENRYQWFLAVAVMLYIIELFLPCVKKKQVLSIILVILFFNTGAKAAGIQKYIQQGMEAYKQNDYKNALNFFIKGQLENPELPEIYYNLGNTYYKMGNYESAADNYDQAFKAKGAEASSKTLKQKSLYNLGNSDFKQGKFKEALANYKKALEILPDDLQAKENLEYVKKIIKENKKDKDKNKDKQDKKPGDKQDNKTDDKSEKESDGSKNKDPKKPENNSPNQKQKQKPDQKLDNEMSNNAERKKAERGLSDKKGKEKHAERMLNRLKDKPGMGMMQSYQKRAVEKDW